MLVGVNACVLSISTKKGFSSHRRLLGLCPNTGRIRTLALCPWRCACAGPSDGRETARTSCNASPRDLRLLPCFHTGVMPSGRPKSDLLVLVPLLSHQEVLGAFLVDYSNNHRQGSLPSPRRTFSMSVWPLSRASPTRPPPRLKIFTCSNTERRSLCVDRLAPGSAGDRQCKRSARDVGGNRPHHPYLDRGEPGGNLPCWNKKQPNCVWRRPTACLAMQHLSVPPLENFPYSMQSCSKTPL